MDLEALKRAVNALEGRVLVERTSVWNVCVYDRDGKLRAHGKGATEAEAVAQAVERLKSERADHRQISDWIDTVFAIERRAATLERQSGRRVEVRHVESRKVEIPVDGGFA